MTLKSSLRGVQSWRGRHEALYGMLAGPDWWDPNNEGLCIWAAYQPKSAGSFAASLVDLSGNGNNAGDPGGAATPGWNAINGWVFDGIGDYLTTTFIGNVDQSQSLIVQFTGCGAAGTRVVCGSRAVVPVNDRLYIIAQFPAPPNSVIYGNGGTSIVIPNLVAGNLATAGNRGYRNGVVEGAAIAAGVAYTMPVWIGCLNQGGAGSFFDGEIQALAIYDCTLTGPQVLSVATAMAAL